MVSSARYQMDEFFKTDQEFHLTFSSEGVSVSVSVKLDSSVYRVMPLPSEENTERLPQLFGEAAAQLSQRICAATSKAQAEFLEALRAADFDFVRSSRANAQAQPRAARSEAEGCTSAAAPGWATRFPGEDEPP